QGRETAQERRDGDGELDREDADTGDGARDRELRHRLGCVRAHCARREYEDEHAGPEEALECDDRVVAVVEEAAERADRRDGGERKRGEERVEGEMVRA